MGMKHLRRRPSRGRFEMLLMVAGLWVALSVLMAVVWYVLIWAGDRHHTH